MWLTAFGVTQVQECVSNFRQFLNKVAAFKELKKVNPRCRNHKGRAYLVGSSTRIKIVDVVVTLGLIDSFLYLKAPQSTLTSSPLIMVHNRIGKVEPRYMSHISSMPSSKTFARPPSRVSKGIPGYSLRMEMIRTFFPFPL